MSLHRTPTLGDLGLGAAAGSRNLAAFPPSADPGLRPLMAFLDMALPLDEGCSILDISPAPRRDDAVEGALDRALEAEVLAGRLIQIGTRIVVDVNTDIESEEAVYGSPCSRCGVRPAESPTRRLCESCGELLRDIAAAHRHYDEVNDYGCEGEAA